MSNIVSNYENMEDISECADEIIKIFVNKQFTIDKAKETLTRVSGLLEKSKVSS
ncbi:MAG: hypothetical protein ACRCZW_01505 [Lactobacillaceae bacterium]